MRLPFIPNPASSGSTRAAFRRRRCWLSVRAGVPGGSLLVILAVLAMAGCVSTEKRFEKGVTLEAQGSYVEAAGYYIDVLKREATWEEARVRLHDVGGRAVEAYLAEARTAAGEGHYEEAVSALERLDALRDRAEGVNVSLAVPDAYEGFRREMIDRAILALAAEGEDAEQRGDWEGALRAYSRAQQRYPMPAQQRRALDEARARVQVRWGEQDLAHLHYRVAFDRAGQALEILGSTPGPLLEKGQALQATALSEGTHYVSFFPLRPTQQVARNLPSDLLQVLNDALQYEYWDAPPLFLDQADPAQLRRELRRLRYDRLTVRQAAEIGRVLDVDFVVVSELTSYEVAEKDVERERIPARTRGRGARDTSFVLQRFTRELEARVTYSIISPATWSVIEEGSVQASARGVLEEGRYAGNPDRLDLSFQQRRLFDPDERAAAERALENKLVGDLAGRMARRVFDRLLARIP